VIALPTVWSEKSMQTHITNYDGGVVTAPQKLVRPESVEELQAIVRDTERFPGPVRPMGSFHSLTPCAASSGTVAAVVAAGESMRASARAVDPNRDFFMSVSILVLGVFASRPVEHPQIGALRDHGRESWRKVIVVEFQYVTEIQCERR
jgi:hypothetical protein